MASIWQIFRLRSPSIYDYSSPMSGMESCWFQIIVFVCESKVVKIHPVFFALCYNERKSDGYFQR